MPHKRNPVPLAVVISAGIRAPQLAALVMAALPQEHERGLGGWHAEWEILPELCAVTLGADLSMWQEQTGPLREHFRVLRYLAELDYVTSSRAAATKLAENYVGLPL